MVRQFRHRARGYVAVPASERHLGPIRLEAEFAVGIGEAVEIVRSGKIRLAIDPAIGLERRQCAPAGIAQRAVDQFARRHVKTAMLRAQPPGQRAVYVMVGTTLVGCLDQLWSEAEVL